MIDCSFPRIVTETVPGPKSMAFYEERLKYVPRGVGNVTRLCIGEAKGALLKDIDGNVFLDFAAGIGMQNVGHCDETITNSITMQSRKLGHPCFHVGMYEPYVDLAKKLCEILPIKGDKKVMFANSGAEAIENAVKIAKKYTGKTGLVSLECAFHGRTHMAMSLTSKVKPYKNGFGPFVPDTHKIPTAYCYRCEYGKTYPSCNAYCADKLQTLLKGELCADSIAALIVEPVQGEGGFIPLPEEFLLKIQKVCKQNGIVFIVDEIQSGFGRTGKMFASEHFDLEPDIITMSKSLGAGMPISAIAGKKEIMDAANPGELGGTYGGAPAACCAAMKVIERIQHDNLCARAEKIGSIISARLHRMREKHDCIGDVRGMGAMMAVEFVGDDGTKAPAPQLCAKIIEKAMNRGVLFIKAGIFSNLIRFLPPLVMSDKQVEFAMDVLEESVSDSEI